MRYWCDRVSNFEVRGGNHALVDYFVCLGYRYGDGYGGYVIPSMLVTGVKIEEVVLNAVLV